MTGPGIIIKRTHFIGASVVGMVMMAVAAAATPGQISAHLSPDGVIDPPTYYHIAALRVTLALMGFIMMAAGAGGLVRSRWMDGMLDGISGRIRVLATTPLLPGVLSVLGVILILVATMKYGAGVNSDSVQYIAAARSLLNNGSFRDAIGSVYTHWPPLFPVLIALPGAAGIEPYTAARLINALAFGATILMTWLLLREAVRSRALILLGTLTVFISPVLMSTAASIWSEPVFTVLVLVQVRMLGSFLHTPQPRTLILLTVVTALACLERYLGVTLILSSSLMIIALSRQQSLKKRMLSASMFTGIAVLPLMLWFLRNRMIASTFIDWHQPPSGSLTSTLTVTGDAFAHWVVIEGVPFKPALVLAGLTMAAVGAASATGFIRGGGYDRGRRIAWCTGITTLGCVGLPVVLNTWVLDITQSHRMFSPVYPLIVIMAAIGLDTAMHTARPSRFSAYALTGWVLWLSIPFADTAGQTAYAISNGAGEYHSYNTRQWHASPLIRALREDPPHGVLLSNAPAALYLHLGLAALMSPRIGESPEAVIERYAPDGPVYLAWFDKYQRDFLIPPRSLSGEVSLSPVVVRPDGTLFRMEMSDHDQNP